ncbi:MAG TPA: cytochrome c-type biogenesis protein CcmH [Acidimicrobiales bacterium]|nr:cytochrome c-type biogenesis protein CcmH [Acidimicrobiales bacterium]
MADLTASPPPVPAAATPSPPRGAGRSAHPGLGLLVLLVVLGVALAFGSGLGSGGHPTNAQRAAALDAQIRCPSCEDLSVAQSAASSAIAVRHQVRHLVDQGKTDQQIEDTLVAQYGTTILLRPPTSGLTALVWVLPAVAGAIAVGALAVLFWRRSRSLARLRREDR